MRLPVVWLEEAIAEFYDAEQWYADISPDLSRRFVLAVEDTVTLVVDSPARFPVLYRGRRRAGVRRFPYGIFYTIEQERIVVIACFHGKRNPRHWRQR